MTRGAKKKYLWGWLILAVLAAMAVAVVLNRQRIYDFFRGISYKPTAEMVEIREKLNLTDEGVFLFNASRPELNVRDEFNEKCRAGQDFEVAVLGCYMDGNIYVYDIESEELDGIRELTTAHELLHAAYARMPSAEKEELEPILKKIYAENGEILRDDISTYDDESRMEEIYVRAGTEIKALPDVLEKEYARIFRNQDGVVGYYEKYIAVFREVEAEMDALADEIETLADSIEEKTDGYERRLGQLNADIVSFNSCAEVQGCMKSEDEFNTRRAGLVAEQEALEGLYKEINELIEQYNQKIETYNKDVLRSNELNRIINSSERPDLLQE